MEQKGGLLSFFPILAMFVLFYFILIRPQQKKNQEQKKMLESLKVGDIVVLTSGIICEIDEIPEGKDHVSVKLNPQTVVTIFKDVISAKYEEKAETDNKKKK